MFSHDLQLRSPITVQAWQWGQQCRNPECEFMSPLPQEFIASCAMCGAVYCSHACKQSASFTHMLLCASTFEERLVKYFSTHETYRPCSLPTLNNSECPCTSFSNSTAAAAWCLVCLKSCDTMPAAVTIHGWTLHRCAECTQQHRIRCFATGHILDACHAHARKLFMHYLLCAYREAKCVRLPRDLVRHVFQKFIMCSNHAELLHLLRNRIGE